MRTKKNTLKVAEWLAKEYSQYSPAARGRKIRETLGDSKAARSFVRRMLPDYYEDAYGESGTAMASDRSAASRTEPLRARSR